MPELDRGQDHDNQPDVNRAKEPTFDELTAQKRVLFAELERHAERWGTTEKLELTTRIFEHSFDDGLAFANKIGMSSAMFESILTNHNVRAKHPKLMNEVRNRLSQINASFIRTGSPSQGALTPQRTRMMGLIRTLSQQPEPGFSTSSSPESTKFRTREVKGRPGSPSLFMLESRMSPLPSSTRVAIEKVDDYYEHFIRQRRVRELDPTPDPRSRGEILGQRNLERTYRVLTTFDSKKIKRVLTGALQRRLSLPQDQLQDLGDLMRKAGANEDTLVQFLEKLKNQSIDAGWLKGIDVLMGLSLNSQIE